jgi:uncharacterized phiE125 gp8 family phage protein
MSLQLNTPPAEEPVSLDEAKAHLRVDSTDDDALIASLIAAARTRAEWHTGRALVTQGWTLWLDRDVAGPGAALPLPPLQSVASVTLYAAGGDGTVLGTGDYFVDAASQPGRVCFVVPLANLRPLNSVAIAYIAGYGGADAVPQPIKAAILMMVAALYSHRGDDGAPMPEAALALLAPYRMVHL